MSYLTQMIALATHNFFSAAAGIAVAIAVVRGFARHSARTLGNFWVDFTRCTLYILLPLSIRRRAPALLAGRDPEPRAPTPRSPRSKARCRPSRRDRSRRRKPSRCSAPTAAASSTPIPPIPTRTPRRSPTSSRWCCIFVIPAGLTYTFGKMVQRHPPGLGALRRHDRPLPGRRLRRLPGGAGRQSRAHQRPRRRHAPGGNMEGKEVRFGIANSALFTAVTTDASCGAVNNMHDSLTPARRPRPAGQHRAGRSHLRRRRLGPLRHAAVRHPRRLHRRTDGRPHARSISARRSSRRKSRW